MDLIAIQKIQQRIEKGDSKEKILLEIFRKQWTTKEDLISVEWLMQNGADPNHMVEVKKLLFDFVITVNRFAYEEFHDIVEILVKYGAKFDPQSSLSLEFAASHSYDRTIQLLFDGGMNINIGDSIALSKAVKANNLPTAKLLIELGSEVNSKIFHPLSSFGPFIKEESYLEMIMTLIQAGSEPNACDSESLFKVMHFGSVVELEYLVRFGADVHARDSSLLIECLNHTPKELMAPMVKFILDNRISLKNHENIIVQFCKRGNVEVMNLLQGAGVDFLGKNDLGLQMACESSNLEIMEELLRLGANPNGFGNEIPITVISNGKIDALKLLLKYNVDIKSCERRALKHAVLVSDAILELLIEKGADVSTIKKAYLQFVRGPSTLLLLIKNGCDPSNMSEKWLGSALYDDLNVDLLDLLVERSHSFKNITWDEMARMATHNLKKASKGKISAFIRRLFHHGFDIRSCTQRAIMGGLYEVMELILRSYDILSDENIQATIRGIEDTDSAMYDLFRPYAGNF